MGLSFRRSICFGMLVLGVLLNGQSVLPAGNGQGAFATGIEPVRIPLYFIPNQGQVDSQVLYYARAPGYTVWLTRQSLFLDLYSRSPGGAAPDVTDPGRIHRSTNMLAFQNANQDCIVKGLDRSGSRVNYFTGSEESKWIRDITAFRAVLYKDIYPGIDLRIYGQGSAIEYDWIIRPGGEVSDIRFTFTPAENSKLDPKKNLVISTPAGRLLHKKPVAYQISGDPTKKIEVEYIRARDGSYRYLVGDYDQSKTLIVDPIILNYCTLMGGDNWWNEAYGIALDAQEKVYVTGITYALNFPTKNAYMLDPGDGTKTDVFVFKLDMEKSGNASLIYSTYLGGNDHDGFTADIAVDASGYAYVTGYTRSTNYPTKNAYMGDPGDNEYDVFVTKLTPAGNSLVYSTYLGGNSRDYGKGIDIDYNGNAYITGYTKSTNFPTLGGYQNSHQGGTYDVFVSKLNTSGSGLDYSTFLGGTNNDHGMDIVVDKTDQYAYITGYTISTDFPTGNAFQNNLKGGNDAFACKLSPSGNGIEYSTYLGGNLDDKSQAIAIDRDGFAYLTGSTHSLNYPTKNSYMNDPADGKKDAFISKLSQSGKSLEYSTYLGGGLHDSGEDIAVDAFNQAYVTGIAESMNFPMVDEYQAPNPSGYRRVFVSKFVAGGGSLVFSTCFGGGPATGLYDMGMAIAIDNMGHAYIAGIAESYDFPTKHAYQSVRRGDDFDAFAAKFSMNQMALTLSGERKTDEAWLIDSDYAQLEIQRYNPQGLAVGYYRIYRSVDDGPFESIHEFTNGDFSTGEYVFSDAQLASDLNYTYTVAAFSYAGKILVSSDFLDI